MAVELEFYSVIVPIETLRRVTPERLDDGIQHPMLRRKIADALERGAGVWDPCWYDGQLFRQGSMGGDDVVRLVDAWRLCGLKPTEVQGAETRWKDLCVAVSGKGVIDHRCDWAEYDPSTNSISLASAPQTLLVGPLISRGVEAFEAGDYTKALTLLEPLANDRRRYASDKARQYLETIRTKRGTGS